MLLIIVPYKAMAWDRSCHMSKVEGVNAAVI